MKSSNVPFSLSSLYRSMSASFFLSAFFRWKGALRSLDPLEAPLGDMIGL